MTYDPDSLLGRLHTLPDPRRRQGRRYPLPALLGLLILAALHGESSLRGMWLWARNHWNDVWRPLGFGSPHVPALTTIWNALGILDADAGVSEAWWYCSRFKNHMYVTDIDSHRILELDPNGNFIASWGSHGTTDGKFNKPEGIALLTTA